MPDATRHGFARAAWEAALREAESFLVGAAARSTTVTYAELCGAVRSIVLRPYSFAMVAFLDDVCSGPDAQQGIVLASLVTRKDTGMPGDGYFRAAERAGCDVRDRVAFWRDQVERVYQAYAEGTDR